MQIRAILFDLDGTLLPMDQEKFTKAYFGALAEKMAPLGYEPQPLIRGIWTGTGAMVKNDGSRTNEAAFWDAFAAACGERVRGDMPVFEEFYRNEFHRARAVCGFNPLAARCVGRAKELGFRTALATNPLFPAVATEARIGWAGLSPEDFEFYTTYETCRWCKPSPEYYLETAEKLKLCPEECLMVGNDVGEDMIARTVGMQVFLLTDCLINAAGEDISRYPNGGFDRLTAHLQTLA